MLQGNIKALPLIHTELEEQLMKGVELLSYECEYYSHISNVF